MEKLKQKVMASLQQAASGRGQQQQPPPLQPATEPALGEPLGAPGSDSSTASKLLISSNATAHLTEEEKEILLQVFKKEEQFKLDTIKQLTASRLRQLGGSTDQQQPPPQACGPQDSSRPASSNSRRQARQAEPGGQSSAAIQLEQSVSASSAASYQSRAFAASISARSATPLSRPGSSAMSFAQRQSGAASGCSSSTEPERTGAGPGVGGIRSDGQPIGNCRICRKSITFNEQYHLCSTCNQFVCDDCASYSSSEQHWMCSSCRRRATKPAIPADALRELGLNNQNSSAVRRMTLRLCQNELKMAANKLAGGIHSSADSTASSSNSSSGCSSMSQQLQLQQQQQQHQQQLLPVREAQQQSSRASAEQSKINQATAEARAIGSEISKQGSDNGAGRALNSSQLNLEQQRRKSACTQLDEPQRAKARKGPASALSSLKSTMSQPMNKSRKHSVASAQQQQQQQLASEQLAESHRARAPSVVVGQRSTTGLTTAFNRRASVAAAALSSGSPRDRVSGARKQSTAFFTKINLPQQSQQQQQTSVNYYHPTARGAFNLGSVGFPQTMVTASSDVSIVGNQQQSRRESIVSQQTLIPIPPDQIHLRRLSDQSNLVRRSSIISDNLIGEDGSLLARNRSHSNIDTVSYMNYFYQSPLLQQIQQQQPIQQQQNLTYGYSDDNLHSGNQLDVNETGLNQRRPSDQWVLQQHNSAQQETQSQQQQQQQQQQQLHRNSQELTSIITSYNQKRSRTNSQDEAQHQRQSQTQHSNSSSDLDDSDPRLKYTSDFDSEQTNEYFAPPRILNANRFEQAAGQNMSIPSVSVSEFSSVQPRQQQQQQPILDQVSPMQINSAIEQAIMQQQQSRRNSTQNDPQQFLMTNTSQAMRRGSSGRILPKIPGEQSRSLLDLPLQQTSVSNAELISTNALLDNNGSGNQYSMLDLPAISPTIRRASAPEGQNIKIVVDDMDNSLTNRYMLNNQMMMNNMMMANGQHNNSGTAYTQTSVPMYQHQKLGKMFSVGLPNINLYGKQGEFYERLVLYRDDSLDPNTNMARGFGLQVMGGKIDQQEHQQYHYAEQSASGPQTLQAVISWILPGGPADKVGLKVGDKIIEWDGKCLVNMTYEQVAEVIESSANIAEILINPEQKLNSIDPAGTGVQPHYVRSQRRMSQQTERDLMKFHHQNQQPLLAQVNGVSHQQQQQHYHSTNKPSPLAVDQLQHQPALSAGNLPSLIAQNDQKTSRSGTGRRLPQIPTSSGGQQQSVALLLNSNQLAENSKQNSSSTGQLLENHRYQQAESGGSSTILFDNHLLNAYGEQQSRSVGELYPSSAGCLIVGQPSRPLYNSTQTQLNGNSSNQDCYSSDYMNQSIHSQLQDNEAQDQMICGSIGLQVNVDERMSQLEICVLSAINMYNVTNHNSNSNYYVKVKILPESNRFKPCTTMPRSDMNWNETLLFQNFPIQQIQRMALEIGIWLYDEAPRLSTQIAQPICETLISIQSARERNTDFWPMRRPPTSPQIRRRSLNDLIDSAISKQLDPNGQSYLQSGNQFMTNHHSAGLYHPAAMQAPWSQSKQDAISGNNLQQPLYQKLKAYELGLDNSNNADNQSFTRERSSSNRNLPSVDLNNKLKAQPRRASDEVATSTSYRLSARVSPAPSRRSISVLNVGNGDNSSRPSSRRGSQILMLKNQLRRDSNQQQLQQQQQQQQVGSPKSKFSSPIASGTVSRNEQASFAIGTTPSGRRSSLIGIQSMTGYWSQKNSQSDAAHSTDQDSPSRQSGPMHKAPSRQSNLMSSGQTTPSRSQQQQQSQQQRALAVGGIGSPQQVSQSTSVPPPAPPTAEGSGSNSRRGSTSAQGLDHPPGALLQRKGSFAYMTFRKLKRTMSLNKGTNEDKDQQSGRESRKSSTSSGVSHEDNIGEDEGITRRITAHKDFVGKLKLSFIMTKGQLEVDVIMARGLKYDQDAALGTYVKMYLKGKNKSNKRKTRLVQPWQSPVFKQKIKYDGSLVDNKSLEISVWQKQGGLKGKVPIGFTEIRLSELNLSQLQVGWYNLRSMDAICGSSIELD